MPKHSKAFLDAVWEKGIIVPFYDSRLWRKDHCGAWMHRLDHGDRTSVFGWEVDRIKTGQNGGTYTVRNCRPLQWENNVAKSGGRLTCRVRSRGAYNVPA